MAGRPEVNGGGAGYGYAFKIERRKVGNLEVILDPQGRQKYLEVLYTMNGLEQVNEDPRAAYCPVSLTSVPTELRTLIAYRQQLLMTALQQADIAPYDPTTAPCSPYVDLSVAPKTVYSEDTFKIGSSRYFVGHNILPSTGFGVEFANAISLMRVAVMIMDANIRVSTMLPHRTIYLQYTDFKSQLRDFVEVFKYLNQFEPGAGLLEGNPVLLGFGEDGSVVDLEQAVYTRFPHLQYVYDPMIPKVDLTASNPQILLQSI